MINIEKLETFMLEISYSRHKSYVIYAPCMNCSRVDTSTRSGIFCRVVLISRVFSAKWPKVATVKRLAREYNAGLPAAKEAIHAHNQRMKDDLIAAVIAKKTIQRSLLEEPIACPMNLGMRFVRKYLSAFCWRKAARNTAGNYLDSCLHIRNSCRICTGP